MEPRDDEPRGRGGGWILWIILAALIFMLFFRAPSTQDKQVDFSDLMSFARSGNIERAVFYNSTVTIFIKEHETGDSKVLYKKISATVDSEKMRAELANVFLDRKIKFGYVQDGVGWYSFLLSWGPMILLLGVWLYFMRSLTGMSGGRLASKFGKAQVGAAKSNKKFKDVAGIDEAKADLEEIVDFLKSSEKYTRLGAKMPKGVLLVGPPGCGKTLLAKAVAGEAGAAFLSTSGSEFVEMFVGVGASRVRDLFNTAKRQAPAIIFIDELDAIGKHRGTGIGSGNDEREQTLNQILVEMDGFSPNLGVIIMAATNRPDTLDPALLRPGRFDRRVFVDRPDMKGRVEILKIYAEKVVLAENIDLEKIARATPMFSGADLENLVNEAALTAARKNKDAVDLNDFEEAKDRVIAGKERKSVPDENERRQVACHEIGHALVALNTPEADPLHKVSIIRRDWSLGHTQNLPEKDKYLYDKKELLAKIICLLGGRAAEKIMLDIETTGAENDLKQATELAHKMVCSWGMSEKVGLIQIDSSGGEVFLGKNLLQQKNYSEATAALADEEIKRILQECFERAVQIISEKREDAEKLVRALLEKETLERDDVDKILAN